jgi:DNA invertase Pin-like site-specific DNA recombinase
MAKKTKASPNAAIGYIRVSTEEQAKGGVSLEAQRRALFAYAELQGLELVQVIEDAGVSAFKRLDKRAGGIELLRTVNPRSTQEVKAAHVIAMKLDRLFRNAADCLTTAEQWKGDGVSLHLVNMGGQTVNTSTAAGQIFLTMLAGFAQFERDMISERTRDALAEKRAKRERTGRTPYGSQVTRYRYRATGRKGQPKKSLGILESNPQEMKVIERARELTGEGLSLRQAAAKLNEEGHKARSGKPFHPQQIARMLRDE